MNAPTHLDPILRLPDVRAAVGLSAATLYRMMARNEFPRPVRIGRAAVGWPQSEVAGWLAARRATQAAVEVLA